MSSGTSNFNIIMHHHIPEKNGNEFRRQAVNRMKEEMKQIKERTQI